MIAHSKSEYQTAKRLKQDQRNQPKQDRCGRDKIGCCQHDPIAPSEPSHARALAVIGSVSDHGMEHGKGQNRLREIPLQLNDAF